MFGALTPTPPRSESPNGEGSAKSRRTRWNTMWRDTPKKGLVLAIVVGIGAVTALLHRGEKLEGAQAVLLFAVASIFWFSLWLVIFVAEERSAKDIGVALLTGLVLAGAAFVMNYLLGEAIEGRDRDRRQEATRLAINQETQQVFRGEDMKEFNLTGLDMSGLADEPYDFSYADLSGANLTDARLTSARLEHAKLIGATLTNADLANAVLANAVLDRATFNGAVLAGAVLSGASLSGTDFEGANLDGANLEGAMNFKEDGAILTQDTRCPKPHGDGNPRNAVFYPDEEVEGGRFTCEREEGPRGPRATAAFVVDSDVAVGTPVGQVSATDPDGDSIEFSLSRGECEEDEHPPTCAAAFFEIEGTTGLLRTARPLGDLPGTPDLVTLTVVLNDGIHTTDFEAANSNTTEADIVVVVDATNNPPEVSQSYLVIAGSSPGLEIGRIVPDGDDQLEFRLESEEDGLFDVENGVLILAHEPVAGTTHSLTVYVTSRETSLTSAVRATVKVVEANLPPTLSAPDVVQVPHPTEAGYVVGSITASDLDGLENAGVVFSLTQIDPDVSDGAVPFAIDSSGTITVTDPTLQLGTYTLEVIATDRGFPAQSRTHALLVEVTAT